MNGLSSVAAGLVFLGATASYGTLVISDGFEIGLGSGLNTDLNTQVPARQSGPSTSTYTETTLGGRTPNHDAFINGGSMLDPDGDVLLLRVFENGAGADQVAADLDTDFGSSLAGNLYEVTMDLRFSFTASVSADRWFTLAYGDTAPEGPTGLSTDLGFLFRAGADPNVANWLDGVNQGNMVATGINTLASNFSIRLVVDETGASPLADLYVSQGATEVLVWDDVAANFESGGRFFEVRGHLGGGVPTPTDDQFGDYRVDNFNIEVIPEPASLGLVLLGGLLAARRRRAC